MVTVGNLMKQDLVTVNSATSVVEAAKLMKACNVGSVFISQEGTVVGIVTESDIIRKFVAVDRGADVLPVKEIMSSPVLRIDARRPITEAADVMNKHRTRHLGVTEEGVLVGVVSVRDFLHPVAIDEF
mgnify:CR=1 FL=1